MPSPSAVGFLAAVYILTATRGCDPAKSLFIGLEGAILHWPPLFGETISWDWTLRCGTGQFKTNPQSLQRLRD